VLDTSILGGIDLMRRLKALLGAKRCVELLLLHLDKLPTQKLPCVSGVSGKALPNRSKRKENRGGGEGSERYMPLHFRPAAAAQPQHTAAEAGGRPGRPADDRDSKIGGRERERERESDRERESERDFIWNGIPLRAERVNTLCSNVNIELPITKSRVVGCRPGEELARSFTRRVRIDHAWQGLTCVVDPKPVLFGSSDELPLELSPHPGA